MKSFRLHVGERRYVGAWLQIGECEAAFGRAAQLLADLAGNVLPARTRAAWPKRSSQRSGSGADASSRTPRSG